jgi:hypothetical protein
MWTRSGIARSGVGSAAENSLAASAASSRFAGNGQAMPACAARRTYSDTVPTPTPQVPAIAR